MIGAAETGTPTRFATVRLGDRTLALAVDAVVGVRSLDAVQLQQLPPLLRAASCDVVEAIGTLDEQLLVVLRAGRILDEAMWRKVEASEAPQ